MLIEILSFFFFIFNLFLIILVVMQKNYGGFWSGPSGNDSVAIFGGNQGAGVLQKITWFFGILLMLGSLFLAIYEASQSQISIFYNKEKKEKAETNKQENFSKETEINKEIILTEEEKKKETKSIETAITSNAIITKKNDKLTNDKKNKKNN